MKRLIKKILREEIDKSDRHYRRLDIISDHVHLPYLRSMEGLTIYEKGDQEYIMKKILGNDVSIDGEYFYDDKGYLIYLENSSGWWEKFEYDDKGNRIYYEDSDGFWEKGDYDDRGNRINSENSRGRWWKWEYNNKDSVIYYENSDGYWRKYEYDNNGNMFNYDEGYINDNR